MQLAYGVLRPDKGTTELAAKIVKVLVASGLTYKQAADALDVAQKMMLETTKPIYKQTLPQDG